MMTFERVLQVFTGYLQEDADVDVIHTRQGYSLMVWDGAARNWSRAEFCETPEILCGLLCDVYADYLELEITRAQRELTQTEQAGINAERRKMEERCLE